MKNAIDFRALFRHPFNSKKRKSYRRRAKGLLLDGCDGDFGAASGPVRPRFDTLVATTPPPYSTNIIATVATLDLRPDETPDLGVANHAYISLTTIPPRADSDEFFHVLDALVGQKTKARKIFLALPLRYQREFDLDWASARRRCVERIAARYGDAIVALDCRDYGPATKILGLLEWNASQDFFGPTDRIIVLDDDNDYRPDLVYHHVVCDALYLPDFIALDQRDLVRSWEPYRFRSFDHLYSDLAANPYGWLSFSARFSALANLPAFFEDVTNAVKDARFHDDAVIAAYVKKFGLYGVSIRVPTIYVRGRMDIDGRHGHALRLSSLSAQRVREGVTAAIIERYLFDASPVAEERYRVPSRLPARQLANCRGLTVQGDSQRIHAVAHYFDRKCFLFTVTVFDDALVGKTHRFTVTTEDDRYELLVDIPSTKFTLLYEVANAAFAPVIDHSLLPIVQTRETNLVTRNMYNSICTILNNAPSHPYQFYSDDDSEHFLRERYSALVCDSFRSLIPGAYKADLFRYCYLYLNMAIYCDCKLILRAPIASLYALCRHNYVFVEDARPKDVYNAFLLVNTPKLPALRDAIFLALENIVDNNRGADSRSVTGPAALGEAFRFHQQARLPLVNDFKTDFRLSQVYDRQRRIFAHCAYHGYYEEGGYLNRRHYGSLWEANNVYRLPSVYFYDRSENVWSGLDKIFWIESADATAPHPNMETIVANCGVPCERIRAPGDVGASWFKRGRASKNSNAARLESHLQAMARAERSDGELFLIAENRLSPRFLPFMSGADRVEAIARRAPPDWEAILLSWVYCDGLAAEFSDWNNLLADGNRIFGVAAYLIRRSAVQKVLRDFPSVGDRFDLSKAFTPNNSAQDAGPSGPRKRETVEDAIYTRLRTYAYRKRMFAVQNVEALVGPDHAERYERAQSVLFNALEESILLAPTEAA